jgi:hypothetical protein
MSSPDRRDKWQTRPIAMRRAQPAEAGRVTRRAIY